MRTLTRLSLVAALFVLASAPAFSTQIFITEFTKNVSLSTYCGCYPSGTVAPTITDSGAFGAPVSYFITPASPGNNAQALNSSVVTIGATDVSARNITSPVAIYLLLNIFSPINGQNSATVIVNGSGGVQASFDLYNGTDVRCYYLNTACPVTTTSGGNTANVFLSANQNGNAGLGTYVLDEVRLVLPAAFVGKTLLSIELDNTVFGSPLTLGGAGLPLLSAITVDGTVGSTGGGGSTRNLLL